MSTSGATIERALTADDRPAPPAARAGRAQADGAQADGKGERDARQGGRSTAELVTFAISALIVLAVVGLTTYLHLTGGSGPAVIDVQPEMERVYRGGERFYVPVRIANTGQTTAEDVRVTVAVTDPQGRQESAGLELRFLPAGASGRGVVSFRSDPSLGRLSVEGVSYLEP